MPRKRKKLNVEENIDRIIEDCIKRSCSDKDAPYWREFLKSIVINNAVPLEVLESVPVPATEVGRTRFDQVYAACMRLAFPGYRKATLRALLGPNDELKKVKIWRVIYPPKFKLSHILIRASTYQEAFARACDYACRVSLRMWKKIPVDLTIRVMFVGERALCRHLGLRSMNKVHKRKLLKLEGREFTNRQIYGARLCALGPKSDPFWSIIKYSDFRDMKRLRESKDISRTTEIESESYMKEE
jgi:hypothetical protein